MKVKVLDLFSGIGGFSLGLERAGMETVAFCENDKKAQLVLKKHWPEIPIYEDVRALRGNQFEAGSIDLICGGFPCQPFSVAGKQRGQKDDRHLWPEMFRLIQEIKPRWVIGENVAGLINMGLDQVLSDLESEGYSAETLVIPACAVNAPHRRDRVWIIVNSERAGAQAQPKQFSAQNRSRQTDNASALCWNVADTNGERCGDPLERQDKIRQSICKDEPGEELGGAHFRIEPSVGRVANGIPGRVDRLKQLGNAVVPQIPEILGRAIMQIEEQPC